MTNIIISKMAVLRSLWRDLVEGREEGGDLEGVFGWGWKLDDGWAVITILMK